METEDLAAAKVGLAATEESYNLNSRMALLTE
jgi:hypothetical protein